MTPLSWEWGYLIVIALVFSHSHYVWFLCCLSLNCAFDVNQIGNFHLLQLQDGPPLIGVTSVVAQPVLAKVQNCIFNAMLLRVIWFCI